MKLRLKSLQEQVMVITGASSGIGLATARMAAKAGTKLVLAARNDDALQTLAGEIRGKGGNVIAVRADVGSEQDVRHIYDEAKREFGGFDTWVNNAGVSIYGRCLDVSIDDMRKLFDTNFWGVVYGSRIACEQLRANGGSLINLGSEVSDVAVPLQGIYSASKHAIKGWTDALRIELEDAGAPISVTLIKPAAIDTPYSEHAKNYLPNQPKHAPPVYSPDSAAEAILYAACTPVRDLFVGGGAKFVSSMNKLAPRLVDKVTARVLIPGTHSGEPPQSQGALYEAGDAQLRERGTYPGMVRRSLHTTASIHPAMTTAMALGAGLLVAALLRKGSASEEKESSSRNPPVKFND